MAITRLEIEKFTVFDSLNVDFSEGINVFIGENGTGKTHILKTLYSACMAAQVQKTAIDFPAKLARVFRPDELSLHRLVRRGNGNSKARITVCSGQTKLSLSFNAKRPADSAVEGGETWNKQFAGLVSTFIPAKEILSHAHNLIQAIEKGNVDFDDTYRDIVAAASIDLSSGPESKNAKKYLDKLNSVVKGTVKIENEEFYLVQGSGPKLEFQLVAEGLRKLALLWQLIKNGTLEHGSILFWDEPEANINPMQIPVIVDILLELQRDGVQVFVATHDYFFAKYLDIRRQENDSLVFHGFYKKGNGNSPVVHDSQSKFSMLEENSIITQYINLYKEEVERTLK